jgi:hypothetical protein
MLLWCIENNNLDCTFIKKQKRVLEVLLDRKIEDGLISEVLLDSKPLNTTTHGENLRFIRKIEKKI